MYGDTKTGDAKYPMTPVDDESAKAVADHLPFFSSARSTGRLFLTA